MYTVYILQSGKDSSLYIGYTSDLGRRIDQHNAGESRYTKSKIPWHVVYTEKFKLKSDAIKRERFLKKQRNSEFYKRLIQSGL